MDNDSTRANNSTTPSQGLVISIPTPDKAGQISTGPLAPLGV